MPAGRVATPDWGNFREPRAMAIRDMADLTWEEVRDLDRARTVLILPLGAIEAHGPPLPLGSDILIAQAMARAGASRIEAQGFGALILPPLPYTAAMFGAGFPGTISIQGSTVTALILDLAREVTRHGFAALAIANAHLDPAHLDAIAEAERRARDEGLVPVTADPLVGRAASVPGGGGGLGAAIAGALSAAGAGDRAAARTAREIEDGASALRARGAKAWAIACDVTVEGSVIDLGRDARRVLGTVDILVNNAGASASAPLRKITLEDWERMLRVNATGTSLCTREFAPEMAGRGWGRIVNVASLAGLEGAKYVAHYSAAKHAVLGFTRSVALEFAGTGVMVNAVCPGYVDTPMTERTLANVESRAGLSRDQALASVLASAGQTRLVSAEEVAAAVLDLCVGASGRSGQSIVLKAGAIAP